jgi:hemerythrin-like domain-containing protein
MEDCIDRLLEALRHGGTESVPEIQSVIEKIGRLSSMHFEREETIFYPSLRAAFPDLLAELDRQHQEVRDLERNVTELLAQPPDERDARWLKELRMSGTELHDRIQHHIVEEEDELFRLAESRLSSEEQASLDAAMRKIPAPTCFFPRIE